MEQALQITPRVFNSSLGVVIKASPTRQQAKRARFGQEAGSVYFTFYNSRRRHQGLDRQTPDQVYFNPARLPQAA